MFLSHVTLEIVLVVNSDLKNSCYLMLQQGLCHENIQFGYYF